MTSLDAALGDASRCSSCQEAQRPSTPSRRRSSLHQSLTSPALPVVSRRASFHFPHPENDFAALYSTAEGDDDDDNW